MDPSSQPPYVWVVLGVALLAITAQALLARRRTECGLRRARFFFWVGATAWVFLGLLLLPTAGASAARRILAWALPTVGLLIAATLRWALRELPHYLREEGTALNPPAIGGPPQLNPEDRHLARQLVVLMARAAADVMVPAAQAPSIRGGARLAEILDRLHVAKVSRLPVLDESQRRAIGVVVGKDLLAQLPSEAPPGRTITAAALAREISTVPLARRLREVLAALRRNEAGVAAVVDDEGRVAGFISWERVFQALAPRAGGDR